MKSLEALAYQPQRRNRIGKVLWIICADVYCDIFTGRRKSSQLIIHKMAANGILLDN